MPLHRRRGRRPRPLFSMSTPSPKIFEVGLVLRVRAQSVEDARRTLEACIPSDLRLERREVQYCEESLARITYD